MSERQHAPGTGAARGAHALSGVTPGERLHDTRFAQARALRATVLITTKDRKDELRRAIRSCMVQTAKPDVLVVDDGSSDGTAEMVKKEFASPLVKLVRNERPLGIVDARNKAADLVSTQILITLDDDALFATPRVVEQTLAEFDHPRVAVVTMPLVNFHRDDKGGEGEKKLRRDDSTLYKPTEPAALNVSAAYFGGANAMRIDVFRALGKYRGYLFRQGEESDYGIRVLDAGYVTRVGKSDIVEHYPSPSRNTREISKFAARNSILFAWYNVPPGRLLIHWIGTSLNLIRFGFKRGHVGPVLSGLLHGFAQLPKHRKGREPVSPRAYRLFRYLMKAGCVPLREVEEDLGTIKPV